MTRPCGLCAPCQGTRDGNADPSHWACDATALTSISESLSPLASDEDATAAIHAACSAVMECGFNSTRVLKQSKWHRSRRWRAVIEYTVRRGAKDVHLCLVHKDGQELDRVHVITSQNPWTIAALLGRGNWEGETYVLAGTGGQRVASVSAPVRGA